MGIYNTPVGVLYVSEYDTYRPQIVYNKNMGKFDDDDEWEAFVKKQKGEQLTNEERRRIEEERRMLMDQDVVRNQVKHIFSTILTCLELLSNLAASKISSLDKVLFKIVFHLIKLERDHNLREPVRECILNLCAKSFIYNYDLGMDISMGLRLINSEEISPETKIELFTFILNRIYNMTLPLPGHKLSLVLPIICNLMEIDNNIESRDKGIVILEKHVGECHTVSYLKSLFGVTRLLSCRERGAAAILSHSMTLDLNTDKHNLKVYENEMLSPIADVRLVALKGLHTVPGVYNIEYNNFNLIGITFALQYDTNMETAELAEFINQQFAPITPEHFVKYFELILSNEVEVQEIISKAITKLVSKIPTTYKDIQNQTFELFKKNIPTNDDKEYRKDRLETLRIGRRAAVKIIKQFAYVETDMEDIKTLFRFIIKVALLEEEEDLHISIVEAGIEVIDKLGKQYRDPLLALFQGYLGSETAARKDQVKVKESVVTFMGSLGQHFAGDHDRVIGVIRLLLDTLKNSSEPVALEAGNCLVKLVSLIKEEALPLLETSLEMCIRGSKPNERRGGAHALAAIVAALKYTSLKKYDVLDRLQRAIEDRDNPNLRQGALSAFELLSFRLGILFEPYVSRIVPHLLLAFDDQNGSVRTAASKAARAIMSKLTAHGVKIVLNPLLNALRDKSWRTKVASIEILGSMAFCQPKQLSACLPKIVPELSSVLTDSHLKVQASGKEALKAIGAVIKNPEILVHVPIMLDALYDPGKYSSIVLEALLKTNYVHIIDAPSLALIMPLCFNALKDRSTDTKIKAAKIVGNISKLTDSKDLKPYLPQLTELIKLVLVDPIPNTRAIAAKAVGSLVKEVGEEEFPDLIQWLLGKMQHETQYIERCGGAQGLSEVIAAVPEFRFANDLLPLILQMIRSDKSYIRQGYVILFQYLPDADNQRFIHYIDQVLPALVRCMADEIEDVREASNKAGVALVNAYSNEAMDILLPTFENGVFDENWRIRHSSIQLLGEFLVKITHAREPELMKEITEVIGNERGSSILAALYLMRHDPNTLVCHAAINAWKLVVMNTPKTIMRILNHILSQIIIFYSSAEDDKIYVASKLSQELVEKFGAKLLGPAFKFLELKLNSEEVKIREGTCLTLSSIIDSTPRYILSEYFDVLMPTVQKVLADQDPKVQEAAARTFSSLHSTVGHKSVNDLLPSLLQQLSSGNEEESTMALNALKQILSLNTSILPEIIPKLTSSKEMTTFNANALAIIAEASGSNITRYLSIILSSLLRSKSEGEDFEVFVDCASRVLLVIQEQDLDLMINELMKLFNEKSLEIKSGVAHVIGIFAEKAAINFSHYIPKFYILLLDLYNDSEPVQRIAIKSLLTVSDRVNTENCEGLLGEVNLTLDQIVRHLNRTGGKYLPGFSLPKGLEPLLTVYLESLRKGTEDMRDKALEGLRMIIKLTPVQNLNPSVVTIFGPLIRVFPERNLSNELKESILRTLNTLLDTGCSNLRGTLAPLQSTFVKGVSDASKLVRDQSAIGLGKLLKVGARIDMMIKELFRIITTNSGPPISVLNTVYQLLSNLESSSSLKRETLLDIQKTVTSFFPDVDEGTRTLAAMCCGPFSKLLSTNDDLAELVDAILLESEHPEALHASVLAIGSIVQFKPQAVEVFKGRLLDTLMRAKNTDINYVKQSLARSITRIFSSEIDNEVRDTITRILIDLVNDNATDVRASALHALKSIAKKYHQKIIPYINEIVPQVFEKAKDKKAVKVKYAAEKVLLYIFKYTESTSIVDKFASTLDQTKKGQLLDYCNRILSKLEVSDDEEQ